MDGGDFKNPNGSKDVNCEGLNKKVSELEKQLGVALANLDFIETAVSAPLLCSICKQLPRSLPISSCTSHHKICQSCCSSLKVSTCRTCSKPLVKESSPLLSTLLTYLRRTCTWSNMGCSFQSLLEELEKHEQICKYQAVFCWGCQSKAPLHVFDQHDPNLSCFSYNRLLKVPVMKTLLHTIPRFSGQFPLQYSGDSEWNPLAVKFAGKMFYLRIKRIHRRGVWILYTAAQMFPGNCVHYMSTITVSCPDMNTSSTTWTYCGHPTSLVVGLDRVLQEGKCLVLKDTAMEQLMTLDKDQRGTLFSVMVDLSRTPGHR